MFIVQPKKSQTQEMSQTLEKDQRSKGLSHEYQKEFQQRSHGIHLNTMYYVIILATHSYKQHVIHAIHTPYSCTLFCHSCTFFIQLIHTAYSYNPFLGCRIILESFKRSILFTKMGRYYKKFLWIHMETAEGR